VTALTLHSTSARVRAIRDRQAEKAAKALLEQQSSPKNKKRPAARMAANPTTGHSCSQCGATVRSVLICPPKLRWMTQLERIYWAVCLVSRSVMFVMQCLQPGCVWPS
jgi:hypothetical protein